MREPVRIARNQQLELFKSELNLLIAQKEVIQKELNDKNSDDENKPSKSDLRFEPGLIVSVFLESLLIHQGTVAEILLRQSRRSRPKRWISNI